MDAAALTETLRETLAEFEPSGEPRTTTEVAEALDLGRRSTYNRLERLAEHGRIETKKVGANARVWWRPRVDAPTVPEWSAAAESLVDDVLDHVEVGIFVLDEEFDIAWINEATERYFGLDGETVVGRDKRQLVDEHIRTVVEDSEGFAETVLATYDDNTYTETFKCHVESGDDRRERWLEHRSKPIEAGAYAGGRVEIYYDVTDRERTRRARQEERAEFESLINAVEEYAIFTLDPDGYVRTWNPGAERIKGYAEDEIVGEQFSRFYTEADREAGVPERNLAAAAERGAITAEGWRVRADGSRFWANVTLTAIRDESGELTGYAKVTRDTTERRERERQLRRERDLNQQLFDTAPVRLVVTDGEGRVERMNSRAQRELGIESTGEPIRESVTALDADGEEVPPVREVIETGTAVSNVELEHERPDGERRWVSVTASPLFDESGDVERVVAAGKDITELKQKERQLGRQRDELEAELDDVFERVGDAFYALDEEMRFEYVNERAQELIGAPERELLGRTVWDALSVDADDPVRDRFRKVMETQEPTSFERHSDPLGIWEVVRLYPSESGLSVYFTEISERKERERELEEYRHWTQTLIENFPSGAVALVDEDLRYVKFGGTPGGDVDLTGMDLEGRHVREVLPDRLADVVVPAYEAALQGEPSEFEDAIGDRVYRFHFAPVRDDDGTVVAATATSRDVTEQIERERRLRETKALLEAAAEAGSVSTWVWSVPDDEFVADASLAEMFGVDPETAREGISLDEVVSSIYEEDRERVRLAVEDALDSCGTYREEYRVRDDDDEIRWVVARGRVECDDAGEPLTFPGTAVDITERKRAEKELESQRKQLTALNSLNEVVQDITAAVVEQSTQPEIEEALCERLAAAESYLYAWIGEVDPASQTVEVRTEAGVEGYLDDITVSVDPDDARSDGPVPQAFRTGKTQVVHDVRGDDRVDPWRDHVERYGFRSVAAVPISHEGTIYGVLNVYAARPFAFQGREREIVGQLGEVAGQAIAAAERKQALLSDELVELDFQVPDVFAAVDAPVDTCGTITLDHTVQTASGEFLVYGSADPEALDSVQGLVDVLPHWRSVTVISDDDPVTFELSLSDPPVLSAVASRGGYVDEAIVEEGDYRMTIHLAPTVDVRTVVDIVEEAYPQAELLRRQQITHPRDESHHVQRRLATDLTDRQRTALEAAYHAGFFEWPRETTGEQIAESLDVASPTFHYHFRKAQAKVFDVLLSTSIPSSTA